MDGWKELIKRVYTAMLLHYFVYTCVAVVCTCTHNRYVHTCNIIHTYNYYSVCTYMCVCVIVFDFLTSVHVCTCTEHSSVEDGTEPTASVAHTSSSQQTTTETSCTSGTGHMHGTTPSASLSVSLLITATSADEVNETPSKEYVHVHVYLYVPVHQPHTSQK